MKIPKCPVCQMIPEVKSFGKEPEDLHYVRCVERFCNLCGPIADTKEKAIKYFSYLKWEPK